MQIRPCYSLSPPEVQVACALSFYKQFTRGWQDYSPARRRCGYDLYRLCASLPTLQARLSGWELSRQFPSSLDEMQTFRVTASPDHPVYALYSPTFARMTLSFHYLPDPLPPHYIPRFRAGSERKHRLFYCIKEPKRRRLHPPLSSPAHTTSAPVQQS